MKPLSEQALEEEILVILRYPNGKRPPRNSIAEEIRHEQAEKLLDLILSDRKAWGEQLIQRVLNHSERLYDGDGEPVQAVRWGQVVHERNKMRQRNQGEKD